jgi:hypothetical protein
VKAVAYPVAFMGLLIVAVVLVLAVLFVGLALLLPHLSYGMQW